MKIPPETLNAMLVTQSAATGVYLDHNRHSAVVVRTKEGIVHYLSYITGRVELHKSFHEKFVRDFNICLYHYPALRALRSYAKSGLFITEEAKLVLRAILLHK